MDIGRRFQDLAQAFPQRPFIIFRDQPITYQQAAKSVNKLSHYLLQQQIGKRDKIAVYLPNSPECIISYLAVFSLGAAVVPLDPRLTDQEVVGILNHAECSILISKPLEQLSFTQITEQAPGIKKIIKCLSPREAEPPEAKAPDNFLHFSQILQQGHEQGSSREIDEQALAILYYTSGTTGKPKAVMSNYRSLDNAPETIKLAGLNEENTGTVSICALSLSHLGGFVYLQFALQLVMSIVLLERFVPLEFLKNIEKHKVSWFHIVPSMFTALLQLKEFEKYDLTSVKGVDIFGAPSHPSLIQRFGQYCPNAKLWHGWGMTETAAPNTITDQEHMASIGKAPPWFKVKIFDNNDRELPQGQIGEIVCQGWPVMMGYYKEPELTAEVMRNGWLHTGDLGYIDKQGYLYIKGRKKDMIIVGGLNVYSPEVEQVIAAHPEVEEVAVVGVADRLRGEAVKAVVVLKEKAQVTEQGIKAFCRQKLIPYKVPQIVEFQQALPKTRSGKVQKELLRGNSRLIQEQA